MKIAAVVVTFNRKEYLVKNIEALLAQVNAPMDILIIDNASTDGTEETIRHYMDAGQILYENTGENLGGAGGFNFGIRRAYEAGYDAIWIMDDDTYPHPDALEKFLQADKDLNGMYGYLAGKVLWKDGSWCEMNTPKYKGGMAEGKYKQIVQSSFVSMFIPRKSVATYGLPIKEFFIWGDDVEYTRRIALREPSYLVEGSQVLHDTKNNVGSNIVYDDERIDRYRYAYRNEMYIALHEGWKRRVYQQLKIWYHIAKILLKSSQKKRKIRLILSASKEGKTFNPSIEYISDGR